MGLRLRQLSLCQFTATQEFPGGGGSSAKCNQDAIPARMKASVIIHEMIRAALLLWPLPQLLSISFWPQYMDSSPKSSLSKGMAGNAPKSLLTHYKSPLQKAKGTTHPAYGSAAFPMGI